MEFADALFTENEESKAKEYYLNVKVPQKMCPLFMSNCQINCVCFQPAKKSYDTVNLCWEIFHPKCKNPMLQFNEEGLDLI